MDSLNWIKKYRAGEPLTIDDSADAIESLLDELDRTIDMIDQKKENPDMGAFDKKPDIVIPDPDDPKAAEAFRGKWRWDTHEQIVLRGTFTAADQEEMENASSTLKGQGKKRTLDVRTGSARRKLLERMIVDWTLTEDGRVLPVSLENIGRLPANYRKPLLDVCDEIALTMSEEEQEDFLDGVSEPTKESLPKTR